MSTRTTFTAHLTVEDNEATPDLRGAVEEHLTGLGVTRWWITEATVTPPEMFLVSWTGGYEPVQYAVFPTETDAWERAWSWAEDAKHGDVIDVFRIDLATNVIERLEVPKE